MFLVFEGIDGSGKSSLSTQFAKKINAIWTKEPTFSSEQANSLNLGSKDDIGREIEFCIDRVKHQTYLKHDLSIGNGVICDRYIWTGLAYSSVFNPSAFEFARQMYKHKFFVKPDCYIFVDTPIEVCFERRQEQTIEQLTKLRDSYLETQKHIDSKIIKIQGVGKIDDIIENLIDKLDVVQSYLTYKEMI